MQLTWLGAACFKFQDKNITIITDPFSDSVMGSKMPKLKTDVLLLSDPENPTCNNVDRLTGTRILLDGPGEIESFGVFIYGISVNHNRQTIFLIENSELSFAHLGLISKPLSDEVLSRIEGVDVLLIPVGGQDSLNATQAATVISQVEPRIVVPMYFKTPQTKLQLDPIDAIAKEMGWKSLEPVEKMRFTKKDLPQEETRPVLLQPATE